MSQPHPVWVGINASLGYKAFLNGNKFIKLLHNLVSWDSTHNNTGNGYTIVSVLETTN